MSPTVMMGGHEVESCSTLARLLLQGSAMSAEYTRLQGRGEDKAKVVSSTGYSKA